MLGLRSIRALPIPSKLFILASVWASVISFGIVGLYPGSYNTDPHLAINLARYYIHRETLLAPLFDIGTHGFLHSLLYLPIVLVLELLHVPFSVQDCISIGCVYGISLGLIAVLTYAISRFYNGKKVSSLISLLIVSSILTRPSEIDFISPNAELIGSVLLLSYWSILLYRSKLKHFLCLACIAGVLICHLKYQLIPFIFVLPFVAGVRPRQAWKILISTTVMSLLVDLFAYRFKNDSGILQRFFALFSEYIMTSNPEYPGFAKSLTLIAPSLVLYFPAFIIAWIFLLDRLLISKPNIASGPRLSQVIAPCAFLSVVTLFTIALPGKNFTHYYILLIPATILVANHAFNAIQPHSVVDPHFNNLDLPISRRATTLSIIITLIPFLFSSFILSSISFLFRGNDRWQSTVLMTAPERRHGIHIYGWTSGYSYGSFGAYPVDPALDMELMGIKFSMRHDKYNNRMNMMINKPAYLVDLAVVGNNEILGGLLKPIESLKRDPDAKWARSYQLVRRNKAGWLYRLVE